MFRKNTKKNAVFSSWKNAAISNGIVSDRLSSIHPPNSGLPALVPCDGRFANPATELRSLGSTIAMTYDWRSGIPILLTSIRSRYISPASQNVGIHTITTSNTAWKNRDMTTVVTSPNLWATAGELRTAAIDAMLMIVLRVPTAPGPTP